MHMNRPIRQYQVQINAVNKVNLVKWVGNDEGSCTIQDSKRGLLEEMTFELGSELLKGESLFQGKLIKQKEQQVSLENTKP